MIDITFYKFNKNENSTKVVNSVGETFKCVLIEPTDIINPRIALNHGNPTEYNYARISIFNRYYFVNNWSWSGGRWVALLNVDVLASFKTEIGAQRQYVVRSSARFDGDIIDTLYPAKSNPQCVSTAAQNPFATELSDGRFIVGVVNDDMGAVGCVSYYVFDNLQFRTLCDVLMSTGNWLTDGIEEISAELSKALINPFQYIASCMWIPSTNVPTAGLISQLPYGWWSLPCSCYRLQGSPVAISVDLQVPKHPQQERGAYLNKAPFSRYNLKWPCMGSFPLDSDIVGQVTSITAQCYIDPISGGATLTVYADAIGATVFHMQTQIGVPIQLAQMASNYIGAVGSAIGAVSSAITRDVGGFFSSIGNAIEEAMPQLATLGSNGGISAFKFNPTLNAIFYYVADDDNAHRGKPLMQDVVLNTIPGYIICSDAELECSCTANELLNIKSYLNGGFYYE